MHVTILEPLDTFSQNLILDVSQHTIILIDINNGCLHEDLHMFLCGKHPVSAVQKLQTAISPELLCCAYIS